MQSHTADTVMMTMDKSWLQSFLDKFTVLTLQDIACHRRMQDRQMAGSEVTVL